MKVYQIVRHSYESYSIVEVLDGTRSTTVCHSLNMSEATKMYKDLSK